MIPANPIENCQRKFLVDGRRFDSEGGPVMATGRLPQFAPCLVLLAIATTGCTQSNPFTSRQTMMGSLKASVSQLEFENEKLRKDVAELKAENAKLDSELAREIDVNGEITARLDDAKAMIRRQGGNAQALGSPSRNYEDDEVPPPVTTPKSRTTRGGRKPPAAQIPQTSDPIPFGSSSDGLGYQPSAQPSRDLGSDDTDDRWLPVARGVGTTVR
jgi:hypothetical protein